MRANPDWNVSKSEVCHHWVVGGERDDEEEGFKRAPTPPRCSLSIGEEATNATVTFKAP